MSDLTNLFPNGLWRMAGSEETFEYTVRAASARGRVGVRFIPGGNVRIRLEPTGDIGQTVIDKWRKELPRCVGYRQPGDCNQPRFSTVVPAGDHANGILALMFGLLGQEKLKSFTFNPDMTEPALTNNAMAA